MEAGSLAAHLRRGERIDEPSSSKVVAKIKSGTPGAPEALDLIGGPGPRTGRPRRRRVLQLPSSFAKSLVWRHKPGAAARPGVFSEEQRVIQRFRKLS